MQVIYCLVTRDLERMIWVPLTGQKSAILCACPKPRPRYPLASVVVIFVFRSLRLDNGIVHNAVADCNV